MYDVTLLSRSLSVGIRIMIIMSSILYHMKALDLMTTGRNVKAAEALKLGILDSLVSKPFNSHDDIIDEASRFILSDRYSVCISFKDFSRKYLVEIYFYPVSLLLYIYCVRCSPILQGAERNSVESSCIWPYCTRGRFCRAVRYTG
jgi:hypothetical protein